MPKQYFEMIADKIAVAGWTYGYCRAYENGNREVCIAEAHKDDGHKYIAKAETLLTAFVEFEKILYTPDQETPTLKLRHTHLRTLSYLFLDRGYYVFGFLLLKRVQLTPFFKMLDHDSSIPELLRSI